MNAIASPIDTPITPWISIFGSRGIVDWLRSNQVSLAFSTYQSGKLFLIGSGSDGRLSIFERTFDRAMGMWANGQTLLLATKYQLWRFENALDDGCFHEGRDRLFVPRVAYTTGDVDAHDVVQESSGRLVFVATSLSCLATISETRSLKPLWKPPFISRLFPEDRCHLNGLALRDGRVRYVTAVSTSDMADGWRARRANGGVLIDVSTNDILCQGLSMPHSPRWYREQLWLLNSGAGEFGRVDLASGRFEPLCFCPGYVRGLAFVGDYAVVSTSKPRHDGTFGGLPLQETLAARNAEPQCSLQVIDLQSGAVVHWIKVEDPVSEIYDVVSLPGAICPMALGLKTDEIHRLLTLEEEGHL